MPARAPDGIVSVFIEPHAALLYSLNDDRNPLHADPDYARAAGFTQSRMRGLATLGMTAVAAFRQWPMRQLARMETRFASPVHPGETIAIDLWEQSSEVAFRVRVPVERRRCSTAAEWPTCKRHHMRSIVTFE